MGENLLNFLVWLQNATQQAAIAEAPAVMTAAGQKVNRATGKVEYGHQNDDGVKQLRSNLSAIGEAGINAPGATKAIELGYNIIRHPEQAYKTAKNIIKSIINRKRDITLESQPEEIIFGDAPTVSEEIAENTRRFKLFADQYRGKIKRTIPNKLYDKFVLMFGDKLDMSKITVDDVFSAMRGRLKILRSIAEPHAQYSETGGKFFDKTIKYFDDQELLGEINFLDDGSSIGMIESYKPGTSRKLYDAAIEVANQTGKNGIVSGEHLISAPKTFSTWKHYPNKQLVGEYGNWSNKMMKPVSKKVDVKTIEEAMDADAANLRFNLNNAPVYRLTLPSLYVPVKNTKYFDPEILDEAGNMHVQLFNPSLYKTLIPIATGYGFYNKISGEK